MKRKEEVYLYILQNYKKGKITQQGIGKALGISLSTVNNALAPLKKMQAVEIKPRQLVVRDSEKISTYWATIRKLDKDVIYSTRVNMNVNEIENSLPPGIIYTAFSGYKFLFKDVPADYSEVYVYCTEKKLGEIKKRFPLLKGPPNLFMLQSNEFLEKFKNIAPPHLLFVDLWNVKGWYARDFLNALREKLWSTGTT